MTMTVPSRPPSGTVFLVEDDEGLRDSIASLLRFVGYTVRAWGSATEFLAAIPQAEPAILVTDMRMPGLSGVELHAELIRQGSGIPVVYISGESTVPQSILAMKQGAVDFLLKPFGREELLAVVAKALERERARVGVLNVRRTLTPRQAQVLDLLVRGCGNREIADALGISIHTAKQYKAAVMESFGVGSLAELLSLHAGERTGT